MTEKEFLEAFFNYLDKEDFDIIPRDCIIPAIRNFLEEHHKEYFEVEFIKIEDNQLTPEQQQLMYEQNKHWLNKQ